MACCSDVWYTLHTKIACAQNCAAHHHVNTALGVARCVTSLSTAQMCISPQAAVRASAWLQGLSHNVSVTSVVVWPTTQLLCDQSLLVKSEDQSQAHALTSPSHPSNMESDICSFGVLVLQLLTAR